MDAEVIRGRNGLRRALALVNLLRDSGDAPEAMRERASGLSIVRTSTLVPRCRAGADGTGHAGEGDLGDLHASSRAISFVVRRSDRIRALDLLGRHLGIFPDRVEVTGRGLEPLLPDFTDEEPLQRFMAKVYRVRSRIRRIEAARRAEQVRLCGVHGRADWGYVRRHVRALHADDVGLTNFPSPCGHPLDLFAHARSDGADILVTAADEITKLLLDPVPSNEWRWKDVPPTARIRSVGRAWE